MKTLIIGAGSIGLRHARLLKTLGHTISFLTQQKLVGEITFQDLASSLSSQPEYVVIANKTSLHFETLQNLIKLGFKGNVLVEKPLFAGNEKTPPRVTDLKGVYVGYNMRFHPLIQKLKTFVSAEKVCSTQIYVGQYLPNWRRYPDYKNGYSAHASEGGGVLRDLSHELDYVRWIFGESTNLSAIGGHFSDLEIDSDDVYGILMATRKCPVVSIQMNYLDQVGRREILVNGSKKTLKIDLVKNQIYENDTLTDFPFHIDETYLAQHRAVLSGDKEGLCSYEDGLAVMKIIEWAEKT